MGSVTPLLAVMEEWRKTEPATEFFWIGTKTGPEKVAVAEYGISFFAINSGKLRRYFSWQNFLDPFRIIGGFFQSLSLIKKIRPDVILTAGGFVSVPIVFAGWFYRVPSLVHQQDVVPGLANKLMASAAKKITVTLEESLKYFPKNKTSWIGNPVRPSFLTGSKERAIGEFGLEAEVPTVLILGGGTGSLTLNKVTGEALEELLNFCQIINVTGNQKSVISDRKLERYHAYEFLTDKMKDAMAVADIIVSRAGMGFLSEFATMGKAVVLVPLVDTHQEANANHFAKLNAAIILSQKDLSAVNLVSVVKNLLDNKSDRANLERNIQRVLKPGAAEALVKLAKELTKK